MLRFLMVDAKGRRLLNSGILTDVTHHRRQAAPTPW